jgi:glycerophosphoryl diester phosphodiesterase
MLRFGGKGIPNVEKAHSRSVYIVGHRGAPYHYPENTIASFAKAIELGADGLEADICLTRDETLIVFHDPKPVNLLWPINRINMENLPYPLISPQFVPRHDGLHPVFVEYRNGRQAEIPGKAPLSSLDEYDIHTLTFERVREIYRYHPTENGVEYPIPTFGEFLDFAAGETALPSPRLRFLYLDVKNPGWNEKREARRFVEYGRLIGTALRCHPKLPEELVVGYTNPRGLKAIRRGVALSGERRCQFAYDAPGSLASFIESLPPGSVGFILKQAIGKPFGPIFGRMLGKLVRSMLVWVAGRTINPLKVAQRMGLSCVAVGSLGRQRHLEEIREAAFDRDNSDKSPLRTILHYTLNDPAHIARALDAGANAIVTDRPEVMREVLERRRARSTGGTIRNADE